MFLLAVSLVRGNPFLDYFREKRFKKEFNHTVYNKKQTDSKDEITCTKKNPAKIHPPTSMKTLQSN